MQHRLLKPALVATLFATGLPLAWGEETPKGGTDSGSMPAMDHSSMQGGSPPPDARDPHAYSDGYDFGPIPRPRLGDEQNFGGLLVDRFESVRTSNDTSGAYELQGWYGRDYNRAVIKAEGEYNNGEVEHARTELLWGHAVAAYWDAQLGVRYDGGEGPSRRWIAAGFQGMAPYWFELDAAAYIGEEGRSAFRFEGEYELLFTQKLVLQPRVELNAYGKEDKDWGIGKGLSDVTAGVRLRYEIRREFAPYIGVEWTGKVGDTKDFARDAGEDTSESAIVAGVRFWF